MGTTTKTTITPDPPTAQELALLDQQVKNSAIIGEALMRENTLLAQQQAAAQPLLDLQAQEAAIFAETLGEEGIRQRVETQVGLEQAQLDLLQQQISQEQALAPQREQLLQQELGLAGQRLTAEQASLEQQQRLAPLQEEAVQLELDRLRREGAPSEAQQALISAATERGIEAGTIGLEQQAETALQQLRRELAPQLGLRPGDSPILRRGEIIGEEAVMQRGQLEANLRGSEAAALAGLGGQQQQQGLTSLAQFQQSLANQASSNRLLSGAALSPTSGGLPASLFGTPGQQLGNLGALGLGFAGTNVGTTQALAGQQAFRLGTATQTQQTGGLGPTIAGISGLLGGLGALATGIRGGG